MAIGPRRGRERPRLIHSGSSETVIAVRLSVNRCAHLARPVAGMASGSLRLRSGPVISKLASVLLFSVTFAAPPGIIKEM